MTFKETINNDLKISIKGGDNVTRGVLRFLNSDIKNAEIEKGGEAGDKEIIEIIKRSLKRRKDSILQYEKGNRFDLADKEKEELAILEKYMPEQMSEEEIKRMVTDVIKELGASNSSEFGKVMSLVMSRSEGLADGNVVSMVVKKELND
ncbi:MAG: GatB/YqeY domain-containing protein [Patescibacteria group bacterium]|nr:GatB/YqeY domain-containing protein [Patescibacteria group bacterium]